MLQTDITNWVTDLLSRSISPPFRTVWVRVCTAKRYSRLVSVFVSKIDLTIRFSLGLKAWVLVAVLLADTLLPFQNSADHFVQFLFHVASHHSAVIVHKNPLKLVELPAHIRVSKYQTPIRAPSHIKLPD